MYNLALFHIFIEKQTWPTCNILCRLKYCSWQQGVKNIVNNEGAWGFAVLWTVLIVFLRWWTKFHLVVFQWSPTQQCFMFVFFMLQWLVKWDYLGCCSSFLFDFSKTYEGWQSVETLGSKKSILSILETSPLPSQRMLIFLFLRLPRPLTVPIQHKIERVGLSEN